MKLDVEFERETDSFCAEFCEEKNGEILFENTVQLTRDMNHDQYTGSYEVSPSTDVQTLCTKNKVCNKNITVNEVPVYEVTNGSGGNTFIIGG